MKKRVLIIALLIALILVPVSAASYRGSERDGAFGIGLNLGTNTGVGLKFGMGNFDILANVGLLNFGIGEDGLSMSGDVAVSYNVYTIDGGRNLEFPITVGLGATTSFHFGDPFLFNLGVVVPVGIEYSFAQLNPDVPITVYLRLAPGVSLINGNDFKVGFAFAGYLGALWMF